MRESSSFFEGGYHPLGGVREVSSGAERLNLDEKTIAEMFLSAGYATGAFGKLIELAFQDSRICGKISKAHSTDLIGTLEDRVKRTESYVKDFIPLPMDGIHLKKGKGTLVLRAVDIPGKQVADVRRVILTRKR